ncbi:MAG TPA: glycosyltransferase family 1 protein [Mycobacteriales bacterium]|nr:glycosyltransferase family 1 protein [Mycobacteriales bacterium]
MVALGIDGYSLSEGSEVRGIGTFLRHLIAGLAGHQDFDVSVFATKDVELPAGAKRVVMGPPGHHRIRSLRHDARLPTLIRRSRCEVFHSPALSPPPRSPVPWAQTLHDLTPLVFDDPRLAGERKRWLRLASRVRAADAVICVSHSSARQGIELLGLDPRRVRVIPHGVSTAFSPGRPARPPETPYLLMVATWGPHKGFREAIAALDAVAADGLPHRLLIAGAQTDQTRQRIAENVRSSRFPERVVVLDHLPDLVDVYRGADLVLVPSHAEGFGLPALEAMACGVPVLAADATSLPEVVGDAGVLVPVGDAAMWGDAAVRLLGDAPRRAELGRRGAARAADFTWERAVAAYAEVLAALR